MEIKKVGVVGCGAMGAGIAQVSAQAGYQVIASEINDTLLKKGLNLIDSILTKDVGKQKITQADKEATLARIKGTINTKDFADCDLVIEAVIENMDLKRKVFGELDKICKPEAILASNSSSLSILDMAIATKRLDKVLGIHFFNPVPIMKLVEVIRGTETSEETLIDCDIHHGPCTREVSNCRITLDITPKPVKAMTDLTFRIAVQGQEPSANPHIDLGMPGMNMGPNRVSLRPLGKGRYEGQGVIVRCPSGRRTWKAAITLPDVGVAEFVFDVLY